MSNEIKLHDFSEEPKDSHKFLIITEKDTLKVKPVFVLSSNERVYLIEGTSIRDLWSSILSFSQCSKGWIYEHELVDYFRGK